MGLSARGGWGDERLKDLLAVLAFVSLAVPGLAQEPTERPGAPSGGGDTPTWTFASGRSLSLFPAGEVYPVYIADPHKTENAAMAQIYARATILDSDDVRSGLKAGGRVGILRLDPAAPGGRSWQFSIDAGLDAQFDSNHKLDNIGWDGNYGVTLTTASAGRLSLKLGLLHCSAHVGDEYAERTGRRRLDYTRQEMVLGLAFRISRGWRAYADGGYGMDLLTEEQRRWRAQAGIEYVSRRRLWGGRFGTYAALDVQIWDERRWELDYAVQAGVTTTSGGRRWRVGLQYEDSRPPMGEFFQDSEGWVTFGIWMDL
jgi:hypothetical protein